RNHARSHQRLRSWINLWIQVRRKVAVGIAHDVVRERRIRSPLLSRTIWKLRGIEGDCRRSLWQHRGDVAEVRSDVWNTVRIDSLPWPLPYRRDRLVEVVVRRVLLQAEFFGEEIISPVFPRINFGNVNRPAQGESEILFPVERRARRLI